MDLQNEYSESDYVALAGSTGDSFLRASGVTSAGSSSEDIQQKQSRGEIVGAGAGAEVGVGRDDGGDVDVGAGRQKGKSTRNNAEMRNTNRKEDLNYGPSTAALSRKKILIYGTGHALNDLTAACWFTYLLIFLTDVGLSPEQAGAVMLSGQLADGFATIIVGQLIDNFGRFKVWHAGGSLLVAISFSAVFGVCIACQLFGAETTSAVTVGYSVFAAIFNLGWAATQVSHMSLVNCITANSSSRVSLNSCRNAFSMVANLFLYAIAYAVFRSLPSSSAGGVHVQFRWIAWMAILVGSFFVVVFLLGVREPKLYHHFQESKDNFTKISVLSWFKRTLYYQVALVYMLTRLTTNVSQAFLPFYVVQDLNLGESSKAVVPALIYVCSFLASIALQELHWTGHRLKGVFTLGAFLWVTSGTVVYLLPISLRSSIYAIAGLIGLGNALMLVTATSMQGILVGHDLSGCAFVYGSLSFVDKLACGCVLYLIERLNDRAQSCSQSSGSIIGCNDSLLRSALGLVPGGCALLAAIVTLTMNLGGDTESDNSLLGKLLPNKVESSSSSQDQQFADSSTAQRLKGSKSVGSENSRTVGPPSLPLAPRTTRHIRRGREKPVEALDDDIEKNDLSSSSSSREEGSPFTIWNRLESAMVGRWGSIRKQPQTWLE